MVVMAELKTGAASAVRIMVIITTTRSSTSVKPADRRQRSDDTASPFSPGALAGKSPWQRLRFATEQTESNLVISTPTLSFHYVVISAANKITKVPVLLKRSCGSAFLRTRAAIQDFVQSLVHLTAPSIWQLLTGLRERRTLVASKPDDFCQLALPENVNGLTGD